MLAAIRHRFTLGRGEQTDFAQQRMHAPLRRRCDRQLERLLVERDKPHTRSIRRFVDKKRTDDERGTFVKLFFTQPVTLEIARTDIEIFQCLHREKT